MLQFENLSVSLGKKQIIDNISFYVRPHRFTALIGRNGSGKSTLLSCINQEHVYTGRILEGEKNLALLSAAERAKTIAYLPQNIPFPHIKVREMVSFGRNPYLDFTGRLTARDKEMIEQAMAVADAAPLADRYTDTLSGGERQRAALAMIIAQNTPIALLDEPTSHMDQIHQTAFLDVLSNLKKTGKKTFLIVLHDLSAAAEFADDIVVLNEGKLRFAGSKEDCLDQEIIEKSFGLKRYTFENKIFFSS